MTIRRDTGLAVRQMLLLLLAVVTVGLAGCAVLTDGQVAAVNQFAEATKGFGTSPGTVITAYATLRGERALLESATRTDGGVAARDLENGLRQETGLESQAAASDAAMGVLDDYAQMLSLLSSSRFTDDLQNQAIALGGSIDSGIATFNKLSGSQVGSFGDIVAGIVRGAGGIWIRHEQDKALVAAVTQAKAPVDALTMNVETLMAFFLGSPGDPTSSLFSRESREVQGFLARPLPGGRPFVVLERTQAAMQRALDGQKLAASCKSAAVQYRHAHNELAQAFTGGKTDLRGLVAQIQALSREIKAAKRARDDVKNARNN
jgi:hypothetical protein